MRILLLALLFIPALAVGNLSGNWNGSFRVDGGDHDVPQLLVLKQDGAKLTGTALPPITWTFEEMPVHPTSVPAGHPIGGAVPPVVPLPAENEWPHRYDPVPLDV